MYLHCHATSCLPVLATASDWTTFWLEASLSVWGSRFVMASAYNSLDELFTVGTNMAYDTRVQTWTLKGPNFFTFHLLHSFYTWPQFSCSTVNFSKLCTLHFRDSMCILASRLMWQQSGHSQPGCPLCTSRRRCCCCCCLFRRRVTSGSYLLSSNRLDARGPCVCSILHPWHLTTTADTAITRLFLFFFNCTAEASF